MKHSFPKRLTAFALAIFTVLSVLVAVPILTVGAADVAGTSVKYTFSSYTAGTQYAEAEEHVLDETVTITTTQAHFTSELRLYSSSTHDGYAIIKSAAPMASIVLNAGNKADTLNVYTSTDNGATWTLAQGVATTSSYADHTVDLSDDTTYIKLDVAGTQQVRIKYMTITFAGTACTHENTTDIGTPKDATCGADGITAGIKCADCGKVIEEQATIPATGNHTFANGACTVCGAADPDACAHANTTVLDAVAPTCTETGLTEGLQCADCEEILTAQTTVDALGHTVEIDAAVDATCTETGLTEGKHCSVCNEVLVKQDVIPAGHNYVDGVCTVCNEKQPTTLTITKANFTGNAYAWNAWTATATTGEMISGFGYTYGANANIQVNGSKDGDYIYNTTALPGVITSITLTKASGTDRNFDILTSDTPFDNATVASLKGQATDAKKKVTTEGVTWEFTTNHKYFAIVIVDSSAAYLSSIEINYTVCPHADTTPVEAKDATCIEDGYSAYSVCNACGEVIGKTVIPNLGGHIDADPVDGKCDNCGINLCTEHKWIDGDVIDEGSCTTDKIITQVCENCGEAGENRTIPYEGHKYEGHVCTKCGDIEIIPAGNMTISEFNSIASAQPNKGATTTNKYTVTGMITEIENTEPGSIYGNMYIQDEDGNKLYIYGIYNADGSTRFDKMNPQPQVGDTITVVGVAANFNGPQMVNGWVTELVPLTTPKIMSFSLSLNKGITVNVSYYIPSEWLAENAGAKLVFSNGKELAATAGLATYSVDLTPGQINDALTLTLKVGETEVATHDVSVAQYQTMFVSAGPAGMGLSETRYAALENLLKSINTLAAAADNDLTDELTEDFSEVTKDPVIYDPGELFGSISAVVGEKASIQLNVNVDKIQDVYAIAVTLGNKTLVDGRPPLTDYVTANAQIVLNGLYPTHFDEEINVSVYSSNDNDDKAAILQFTFNSYLKALYDTCEAGSNAQKLVAAIYQYGLAVEAYRSV